MSVSESSASLFSGSRYALKAPSGPCVSIDSKAAHLKLHPNSKETYCPFFWHEPAWHRMDHAVREQVIVQCVNLAIPTSALNCDDRGLINWQVGSFPTVLIVLV